MQRLALAMFFSVPALANDFNKQAILDNFANLKIEVLSINPSPIKGLNIVDTNQGILYSDNEGKHFLHGSLFAISENGNVENLSNKPLLNKLESLRDSMIIYPAENEKHSITVFFDSTCYYCNKLHQDTAELNKLGITVRYLAFPRQGLDSENARTMEAVFSSKDAKNLLEKSMKNIDFAGKKVDIVKKHYELGLQFGVEGTPAIISESGEIIGGYMPPDRLLSRLAKK